MYLRSCLRPWRPRACRARPAFRLAARGKPQARQKSNIASNIIWAGAACRHPVKLEHRITREHAKALAATGGAYLIGYFGDKGRLRRAVKLERGVFVSEYSLFLSSERKRLQARAGQRAAARHRAGIRPARPQHVGCRHRVLRVDVNGETPTRHCAHRSRERAPDDRLCEAIRARERLPALAQDLLRRIASSRCSSQWTMLRPLFLSPIATSFIRNVMRCGELPDGANHRGLCENLSSRPRQK